MQVVHFKMFWEIHLELANQPSAVIKNVTNALCSRIHNYINFPTEEQLIKTKQHFYEMSGFPNVMGIVDGTHINIKAPQDSENSFVNRKRRHSINVQGICDEHLLFTNVVAKWPGRTHDSFIFEHSRVAEFLQSETAPNGWLLGDKGYSQLPYLMAPLRNPTTEEEKRYNSSLAKARNCIERSFGILKSRFRCLHDSGGELCYDPERSCKIIVACFILHNICVKYGLTYIEEEAFVVIEQDEYAGPVNISGIRERTRVIQTYFS